MGNILWYFQVNHKVSDISSEERPIANSTFRKDEEVSSETSDSDFNGSVPVRVSLMYKLEKEKVFRYL